MEPRIVPLPAPLGADLLDVDLSAPLEPALTRLLLDALAQHGVLRARGQQLDEAAQLRLTAALGCFAPYPAEEIDDRPEPERSDPRVAYVINDPEDRRPGERYGRGPLTWHADFQHTARPHYFTLLYAVEVPPGSETQFASLAHAYATLGRWTRLRLARRKAITGHNRSRGSVTQPIIRRHPVTGRKVLYVSRGATRSIAGSSRRRGRRLIRRLNRHVTRPETLLTHEWRAGDLLVWDNHAVIHQRLPFDEGQRRVLRRTWAQARPTP